MPLPSGARLTSQFVEGVERGVSKFATGDTHVSSTFDGFFLQQFGVFCMVERGSENAHILKKFKFEFHIFTSS